MVCNGRLVAVAGGSARAGGIEGRGPCPSARSLRWVRSGSIVARAERAALIGGGGGSGQDKQWLPRQRCEAGCGPWRARSCLVHPDPRRRDLLASRRAAVGVAVAADPAGPLVGRRVGRARFRWWVRAGLVRDSSGQLAGLGRRFFRPLPGATRWQSASGAPSAVRSEESLWALVMDVLCLRLEGSGLEGSVALRWATSGPGQCATQTSLC